MPITMTGARRGTAIIAGCAIVVRPSIAASNAPRPTRDQRHPDLILLRPGSCRTLPDKQGETGHKEPPPLDPKEHRQSAQLGFERLGDLDQHRELRRQALEPGVEPGEPALDPVEPALDPVEPALKLGRGEVAGGDRFQEPLALAEIDRLFEDVIPAFARVFGFGWRRLGGAQHDLALGGTLDVVPEARLGLPSRRATASMRYLPIQRAVPPKSAPR